MQVYSTMSGRRHPTATTIATTMRPERPAVRWWIMVGGLGAVLSALQLAELLAFYVK